ncbi:MAG TPA: SBBP repeat-containing protein [Gemmataceae bacterium]|nr:SBBP repeat-containing protein [Gemmataceae bacterium]
MWPFSFRKTRRTIQARRRSSRLRLEVLEDRTVPASLSWSTYFNGTIWATAVDGAGNVYVTGNPGSNFAATPGAFQTSGSGAFVAKFSSTGALDYATYLGNGNSAGLGGLGIAVDSAGDAYVIGDNTGVPTTSNAIASSGNIFVAELNPTGSALVYSTYLPGAVSYSYTEGNAGGIAVDGSGDIYVAGAAGAGLPVTANAFQTTYIGGSGGNDAFFAKINPTLSGTASLVYFSYLGGGGDAASGLAVDASGNAYLFGNTTSTNFPTTTGAFQRTNGGGMDTFVAKFNPNLSGSASLVYSTYLGGSGTEGYVYSQNWGFIAGDSPQTDGGIAVDSQGNAYVTSATTSTNFPTTAGAFQVKSNLTYKKGQSDVPPSDAFVTKLNPTGTALVYSTYLGGGTNTWSGGAGIAVDSSGDAHVTGWTNSTVFPTKNPLQAKNNGGYDAFVTALNPTGAGLLFSSYFGGSGNEAGFGIALDTAGNAYVGGQTASTNFPTTPGAYQTTPGSGFVMLIDPPAGSDTSSPMTTGPSFATAPPVSQATAKANSARGQESNVQPSPSQADPLFTLFGNNPGVNEMLSAWSGLLNEVQALESSLLARFDSLLSMGFGASSHNGAQVALMRDSLFASLSTSNNT